MKPHLPKMLRTALRAAMSSLSCVSVATGTLAAVLLAGAAPQAAAAGPYIWTADESNVWDTTSLNWKQDGAPTAFKSGSGSAVTFNNNAKKKTVLIDSTLTAGAMTVDGAYTFGGTGKVTVASLNGAVDIKVADTLTLTSSGVSTVQNGTSFTVQNGSGTLSLATLKVAGQAKLGGNLKITGGGNGQGSTNNQLGLCLNTNGEVTISSGTTTVSGATYMTNETKLVVGTGSETATLITTRMEVGDSNGGTSSVSVGQNGKVVITGAVNSAGYKDTSLVFSEWNNNTTVDISGGFYAQGAQMRSGDRASVVNIHGTATVAVAGFTQISGKKATNYTVEDGARLIVGSAGIAQTNDADSGFKIGEVELGLSTATVTISTALESTSGRGITFNTNQYTWGTDKASVTQGETAGTFIVTGAIGGMGGITVTGNGTVNLSAANTYGGNTIVESGTLRVTGSGTLGGGTGLRGTVRVKGGTLKVERDLDISKNKFTIDPVGTVEITSGKKLTVGACDIGKAIKNSGTVIFSANWAVETGKLTLQHDAAGYVDEHGVASTQGFRQGGTDYVQLVEGGTTVDNGARFTYNGESVTYDAATARAIVSISEDTDWTTYELHDSSPLLADIISYAESRGAVFSTVDMYGGSLQVAVNFYNGKVNVYGAGSIGADTTHTIGTVNVYDTGEDGLNFNQTGTPVGNLNILGSSTIKGSVAPRNLTISNGATATVQASVVANTLSVEQGATVLLDNNASRLTAFNGTVDGTVNVDSQGAFYLGIVGTGSGTVNVNGRVDVAAGGTLDIRQGSKLVVGGKLHLAAGANYTEGGALQVTSTGELVAGDATQLGALDIKGRLSVEGAGATVRAKGGTVSTLNISAGQTLNVDGAFTLQSATGEDGNLVVSGALTAPTNLHLDNVTAGSVALTTSGSLTVDNALNTESITLARINREKVYLTAGSLTAGTTDFLVNVDTVESMRLSDGMSLTLADITSALSGTVTVNGGSTISKAGSDYAYTISQDADTKDIILTAHEKESEYIWLGQTTDWADGDNWSGGAAPETGSWVQLRADRHDTGSIAIGSDVIVDRVTAYQDTAHILTGEGSLGIAGRLEIQNSEIQVGSGSDSFQMQAASTRLTDGSVLRVNNGATFATGSLSSDGTASAIAGDIIVYGNGGVYRGAYDNVHITMMQLPTSPAAINQTLAADGGLSVEGTAGTVTFLYGEGAHLGGLNTNNMTVVLNSRTEDAVGKHLVLDSAAAITNGSLVFGLDPESTAATLGTKKAPVVLTAANGLDLTDSSLVIGQGGSYSKGALVIDTDGQTENLVLAYVGDENTQADNVSLAGKLFNKYYTNARLVNGTVLVDLRSGYFAQDVVPSGDENVRTGATMLDEALKYTNPQVNDPDSELAGIMDALESGKLAAGNAEKIAAGLAGASTAALGMAASADVDRQLRAIRNRTTTMGVGEGADRKGMPYVNAWINAEGDYRKLSADGMLAGYKMTSWGGTLGLDVDCTPRFTCGLAVTAMYGDFTADSAEEADGDLDRTYITAFAHYTHRSWAHTLIGTIGRFDTKLSRSINYGLNTAETSGDSDGTGFGLMYELGYTRALNESGTTAIQPVFNVSWRHSSLGGYTETGSKTALTVGDAEADVVTFALGARLQSAYGAQPCNRSSLFEGRVLAKLATGDKDVQTKVNLAGLPTHTAKSAETGSFGVEVGAGLAIPMLRDTDTLFFDLSAEFWSDYTNVNGVVGYRINF